MASLVVSSEKKHSQDGRFGFKGHLPLEFWGSCTKENYSYSAKALKSSLQCPVLPSALVSQGKQEGHLQAKDTLST